MLFFMMLFVALLAYWVSRYVLAPFQDASDRIKNRKLEHDLRRLPPTPPTAAAVQEVAVPDNPPVHAQAVEVESPKGTGNTEDNLDVPAVFRMGLHTASSLFAENSARVKRAAASAKARATKASRSEQEQAIAAQRQADLSLLEDLEMLELQGF